MVVVVVVVEEVVGGGASVGSELKAASPLRRAAASPLRPDPLSSPAAGAPAFLGKRLARAAALAERAAARGGCLGDATACGQLGGRQGRLYDKVFGAHTAHPRALGLAR